MFLKVSLFKSPVRALLKLSSSQSFNWEWPSEEHAVGQLDIQSQQYEGLNSKCLARIYANKQYTTSGCSGSKKRTHTNTKANKNYATKPPDEEPLTNI